MDIDRPALQPLEQLVEGSARSGPARPARSDARRRAQPAGLWLGPAVTGRCSTGCRRRRRGLRVPWLDTMIRISSFCAPTAIGRQFVEVVAELRRAAVSASGGGGDALEVGPQRLQARGGAGRKRIRMKNPPVGGRRTVGVDDVRPCSSRNRKTACTMLARSAGQGQRDLLGVHGAEALRNACSPPLSGTERDKVDQRNTDDVAHAKAMSMAAANRSASTARWLRHVHVCQLS